MQYDQSCFEHEFFKKNQYYIPVYDGDYIEDEYILKDNAVIDYILAMDKNGTDT
jgi:hypothetical protein